MRDVAFYCVCSGENMRLRTDRFEFAACEKLFGYCVQLFVGIVFFWDERGMLLCDLLTPDSVDLFIFDDMDLFFFEDTADFLLLFDWIDCCDWSSVCRTWLRLKAIVPSLLTLYAFNRSMNSCRIYSAPMIVFIFLDFCNL